MRQVALVLDVSEREWTPEFEGILDKVLKVLEESRVFTRVLNVEHEEQGR